MYGEFSLKYFVINKYLQKLKLKYKKTTSIIIIRLKSLMVL